MIAEAHRPGTPAELVFVGLGCNRGSCGANLDEAVYRLKAGGALQVLRVSPRYQSPAFEVGEPQPPFLNQVVMGTSGLSPLALLVHLLAVERSLGRERPSWRAPRTLDLDLLAFGNRHLSIPQISLPHPEAHRRAFVLLPWADLAPNTLLLDRTVQDWLQTLPAADRLATLRIA